MASGGNGPTAAPVGSPPPRFKLSVELASGGGETAPLPLSPGRPTAIRGPSFECSRPFQVTARSGLGSGSGTPPQASCGFGFYHARKVLGVRRPLKSRGSPPPGLDGFCGRLADGYRFTSDIRRYAEASIRPRGVIGGWHPPLEGRMFQLTHGLSGSEVVLGRTVPWGLQPRQLDGLCRATVEPSLQAPPGWRGDDRSPRSDHLTIPAPEGAPPDAPGLAARGIGPG